MSFKLDEQTKKDLDVFPTSGDKSLYTFFNLCQTQGGKAVLTKMMSEPSSNIQFLKKRQNTIDFIQTNIDYISKLDIDKNSIDFIEHYLRHFDYPTRKPSTYRVLEKAIIRKVRTDSDYYIIERGIDYTIELINNLFEFFSELKEKEGNTNSYPDEINNVLLILNGEEYKPILKTKKLSKLKAVTIANFDYMFRYTHKDHIEYFLNIIYQIDALTGVAITASKYDMCYPELLPHQGYIIEAECLFHPFINDPISNDIRLRREDNMAFVTGPNMAGKSTFLKSMGVAAFLAHIGFPVPAKSMKISMLSGIYTTINLGDNMGLSYSHFYSEVKRVKEIVQKLDNSSNMLIIFDELFRGTNVKDAYDGSLAIISALAFTNNSFYLISTHILEVAESLKNKNIQFLYLETLNKNDIPHYTYKVKSGISEERLGMYIIEKEKIIEIINKTFEKDETI